MTHLCRGMSFSARPSLGRDRLTDAGSISSIWRWADVSMDPFPDIDAGHGSLLLSGTFIIFEVCLLGHAELSRIPGFIDSCRCPNGLDSRLRRECHFGNDILKDFSDFSVFSFQLWCSWVGNVKLFIEPFRIILLNNDT